MNYYFLLIIFPVVFCFSNDLITSNSDTSTTTSLLSIRQFILTLNFNYPVINYTNVIGNLEIYADYTLYNKSVGSPPLLYNSSSFTRTLIDNTPLDINITNSFSFITISSRFLFQYFGVNDRRYDPVLLLFLNASNYSSNSWTDATQHWETDNPYISWDISFQYLKQCQDGSYGFLCDNQTVIPGSSTSSTLTSSTISTSMSPLSVCQAQISDLEDQRNKEKNKKNLYFWLWIGFVILSVILFILMALFCCCWLRDRGRVAQREQKPPPSSRVTTNDRRDRVDIVHPHMVYPANQQANPVRQRVLPPYRPPQELPRQRPRSVNQGPIDASSNVALPRTTQYSQPPPPSSSRPFQYPSDDDEWSIPPNEHVV